MTSKPFVSLLTISSFGLAIAWPNAEAATPQQILRGATADLIYANNFETNAPISVDAGLGFIAAAGTTLTLSGSAEGEDALTWTQIEGPTTQLSDTQISDPSLTLPAVSTRQTLVYELEAQSAGGQSVTDTVSIEVWVAAYSASNRTVLGDFSDARRWGCTQPPMVPSTVAYTDLGATTAITGNGIPNHRTGTFPNAGNPNEISEQSVAHTIDNTPELAASATDMAEFGVTLDGVKLERDTAESYRNEGVWSYEALTPALAEETTTGAEFSWLGTDCNNAHVQPTGSYHYHGLMESLINRLGETNAIPQSMLLGGYAADGFPFYLRYAHAEPNDAESDLVVIEASWELRQGTRPDGPGGAYDGTFREDWEYAAGSGDTDECGGRFGVTPEYPLGIYYYVVTDDYPYIPRCVSGTPDDSFRARRGSPMGPPQ